MTVGTSGGLGSWIDPECPPCPGGWRGGGSPGAAGPRGPPVVGSGSTAATCSSCRWGLSTRAASAASVETSAVTLVMTRCSPAGCPAPAMLILATPGRAGTAGLGEWPDWTREAWAGGSAGLGANSRWYLKDRQAETETTNSKHGVPLITRNYYTH